MQQQAIGKSQGAERKWQGTAPICLHLVVYSTASIGYIVGSGTISVTSTKLSHVTVNIITIFQLKHENTVSNNQLICVLQCFRPHHQLHSWLEFHRCWRSRTIQLLKLTLTISMFSHFIYISVVGINTITEFQGVWIHLNTRKSFKCMQKLVKLLK